MSGRNKPSLEFIRKLIASFPETDLYWLLDIHESRDPKTKPAANSTENTYGSLFDLENLNRDSDVSTELKHPDLLESDALKESSPSLRKPVRVVLFYEDGTFESFQN